MRGATIACPKCSTAMPVAFTFCGNCGARLVAALPVEGETKQITVLFADISGFTALAERLDPEELHENMRAAWDVIAAEIRGSGGLIEKYIGDAVVAVFGAVGDEVDHPARAQHAALAILGALDRENERIAERTGRNLALRIGINTGLAVAGAIGDRESEFGVIGDAVNVAARLEQAAEPGEVLVGDATYRLAPGLFAYEPHPPVAAKGKSAPLVAWRLLRLETAATDRGRALLVGALGEALAGKGHIVSIVGEAGLGKTRLVDELLDDPRAHGPRVARARCSPYDAHRRMARSPTSCAGRSRSGRARPPRSRIARSPKRSRGWSRTPPSSCWPPSGTASRCRPSRARPAASSSTGRSATSSFASPARSRSSSP